MKSQWPARMSTLNWIGNKILTLVTNIFYGTRLTDEATGYKVFRAAVLKAIHLEAKGFEFCPEVTAKLLRKGHKIYEVPVSYHARKIKEGKKVRITDGFKAILTLILIKFRPAI